MIRHVVLFHLVNGVTPDDPRVAAAIAAEDALVATAGGTWLFGRDRSRRPVSADYVGTGDFASVTEMEGFLASPAHEAAARAWAGLASVAVADLEIDDDRHDQHHDQHGNQHDNRRVTERCT